MQPSKADRTVDRNSPVRAIGKMAFQENLTGKGLKPMLTNDDAAKMLGVSKRTLQRMRSENRIDFIKLAINADTKLKPLKEWLRNEQ